VGRWVSTPNAGWMHALAPSASRVDDAPACGGRERRGVRVSREGSGEVGGIRGDGECVPVSRARVPKMGGGRRGKRAPRGECTHREDVRHGVAEER
jgi:hypothetical protein